MNSLYLWLDIASIALPLIFSFHPKIRFDREWKSWIPAILVSAIVYLGWDIVFVQMGVWGFNPSYLTGYYFLGLPIEEILFFLCIPYACSFTFFVIGKQLPWFAFPLFIAKTVTWALVVVLLVIAIIYRSHAYTAVNFILSSGILFLTLVMRPQLLRLFLPSFLLLLIPFFIVNGLLTGFGIPDEVVWYNNAETLGFRLLTIPVEDMIYALGMLLLPAFLADLTGNQLYKNPPLPS